MGMEVDRLEIQIQAEASKASASLDKIISQLGRVSSALTATNTSGLRNFSSGIKQLSSAMQSMSNVKTTDFTRLTKGIEKLGSINNSAIYKAGNSIRNFTNSLNGIGSVSDDAVKLGEIANGVSKLGGARIERVVTTLPQLSAALKEFMTTLSTAPNVSENLINMTNAMANLASNGAKFSSTVNGLNRAAKTLSRSNNEAATSTKLFGNSAKNSSQSIYTLTHHINSLVGAYFSLKFIIGSISSGIKKSMDFVETINLFQTSYKKIGEEAAQDLGMTWGSKSADAYAKAFIDRAQTFNDNLTNALGLDPNTMMNYQAVFAQISNSMGLTSRTTENLSESFTMLGNDIASLWNIDTKSAMEKLQSGLIGQTRPLRELGIDVTQASLQLTAYKYGITESVTKMSQAEKVQLRWLTIMNQSSVAFGDMAKTINSPANQLRILKQQFENLARSIGNVFMPIVTTILPYINAVVIALRNMIDTLATALGYELPDYTDSKIYTDVTGDIDGVSDATDNAADSADKATAANEKYKKSLLGIDELNILTNNSTSSSGSGSGSSGSTSGGSGSSALDDAINKETAAYMKKFNEQLDSMSNKSKAIADNIKAFFDKIATDAKPTTDALKKLWNDGLAKLAGFVAQGVIDFYNYFLVPVGKWTLGKGLPSLLDTLNGFLDDIDWNALNSGFKKLWEALSKFTIGIGTGLVSFVKALASALKPSVKTAVKWFTASLNGVATAISTIPEDTAIALGGAIGGLATAFLTFLGAKLVASIIFDLAKSTYKLLYVLASHPLLALAAGLAAIAGAAIALDQAKFDASNVGKYVDKIDDLVTSSKNVNKEIQTMLDNQNERQQDIEDEYGAVKILADKYFDLADKAKLTNKEQALQKTYAQELIKKIPELSKYIDDQTGAYKGTKDQIQQVINKTKEYYKVQAAQSELTEIAKGLYKSEENLKNLEEARKETVKKLKEKQDEYNDVISTTTSRTSASNAEQQKAMDKAISLENDIGELKDSQSKLDDQIDTTKDHQKKLNSQWTYASNYISDYKDTAESDMPKVKSAVKSALDSISDYFSQYKLPKLMIDIGVNTKDALGNLRGIYTDGGSHANGGFIDTYAVGGLPNFGQLFVAREAGPELVGNLSGHSNAVANNAQIEAGIEEAAYRGYARAIIDFGGSNSGTGSMINEVSIITSDEKLYQATVRGKKKSERRYQTAILV